MAWNKHEFSVGCELLSKELSHIPQKRLPQAIEQLTCIVNGDDGYISWNEKQLRTLLKPFRRAWVVNLFTFMPPKESKRQGIVRELERHFWSFTNEAYADYEKEQIEYWGDPVREDEAKEEQEALDRRKQLAIETWEDQGIAKTLKLEQSRVITTQNKIFVVGNKKQKTSGQINQGFT
jgi:hypothetical protein